jgi:methionine-gamma-lyase
MRGGGGVVSFELAGGIEAGKALMNAVRLCTLAVSLGGVETLIGHPASMTHASMGRDARARAGIPEGLVRVSVGIERADEIIADLEQGLAKT